MRTVRYLGKAGVVGLVVLQGAAASSARAQADVFWVSPVSGRWNDAGNWSSAFAPGTPGNENVRAVVNLGGAYAIDLDFNATLSGLALTGSGATLSLTGSGTTLSTTGSNDFTGASITGNQSTTLATGGLTVFSGGATVNGLGMLNLGGRTDFTGDEIDLCDTCVFLTGDGVWSGAGSFNLQNDAMGSEIVIAAGGSLALLGSGARTIQGIGTGNQFVNRGELRLALDAGGDAFEIAGSAFQNAQGGSIRLESGTLRSDLVGTLSGASLRGGDWFVGENGTVDTMGVMIDAIDVEVALDGAGSSFDAIGALERVTGRGAFRVMNGRDFATAAGVVFDVQGEVEVGVGSALTVTNQLMNLSAGTLSDGSFVVGGELELMQGGGIDTLDAGLTLKGSGTIADGAGGSLLTGLSRIGAAGAFALREGAAFTTAGDLGLDGALDIGRGSAIDVRGGIGAFQAGVFGDAALRVAGDLIADNSRVEAVEGRLVVGLDGRILARDGGGSVDGLSFLREIRAGGSIELEGGRDLDLRTAGNTVALEGGLILGATAAGDSDAVLGSVLTAEGIAIAETGSLTTTIAGLDNFGRADVLAAGFGAGGPGETAGTLVIVLADGYDASFGDRFLIISADAVAGEGFATISVDGNLGDGLFFEQFIDSSGVGVVVVPAPGGAVVLGGGLLFAGRRRR